MAHSLTSTLRAAARAAALLAALSVQAQETVVVTGRSLAGTGVAGFGDAPPARSPLQATAIGQAALADAGIASMAGLTRLDASVGDAYNAEGYWASLSARGYALDNRFNVRRDGLPINAETAIALDNKERLELFKGTSGIQAGTSAPGGLVNLVVKRPNGVRRSARLELRGRGTRLAAVDIGQRFGADGAVGVRLNAAYEHLDPEVRRTEGQRWLGALAADWQVGPETLLQAELESSEQRQPSVAGYSLLGDRVPAAETLDPRRNLNDQPWRRPVELAGRTASLRLQQRLAPDWRLTVHALQQELRSDDGMAFPYGVYDAASYTCTDACDRYAPDGSFTYWEYQSNNERRSSRALQLSVSGQAQAAGVDHALEAGVLLASYRGRFEDQVFDIAGTGQVDGSRVTAPSAGFLDANTDRDERSTEWFVRDAMQFGDALQLWAGLRQSRLQRESRRTSVDSDGSLRATDFGRRATTPWIAVARQLTPRTMLYASWGRGLETDVAPARARYANAGQSLALDSRQVELGLKHGDEAVEASLTLFDIDREVTADIGSCDTVDSCRRAVDGSARHRGVEASWTGRHGAWSWQASVMGLQAERRGSQQAGVNGLRPANVPRTSARLAGEWQPPALAGLALQAGVSAEGDRTVLPYDDSLRIPGWSRLDLGARWRQVWNETTLVWRVGLDNATDRRAWKESPYQFGHAYLYPLTPRTWRASLQASF